MVIGLRNNKKGYYKIRHTRNIRRTLLKTGLLKVLRCLLIKKKDLMRGNHQKQRGIVTQQVTYMHRGHWE